MEIRHLKLIREVAETKSLTKAKDALFLSQSALSHQLKEIETELGTPLFHRVNKKLIITGAGKMVLESAERVLHDIEKTELSIKKYVSGDTGTIRLATQCYTCYHWLPSLLIDFKKEFPKVEIEIILDNSCDMEDQVLDGKIDLAIISEVSDRSKLKYHELFRDEVLALVPADHPWTKKKYVDAEDFATENVIIHSYPLESVSLFTHLLFPAGVSPKKVTQIQVTEAMIELVKAGMGIKVVAKWIVEPYLKDSGLAIVPVTKSGMHRRWYAITLDQEENPQYLENFVDHLRCNIGGLCCCPSHQ
ncbi:MAG: LysR family transcriptional regulator [Cyclobacteriaceae bacterium]